MKKQIINCLFAALTIGALAALNAGAADSQAGSNINISKSGGISITSENAEQDGITAVQLSLMVETDAEAEISFDFNQENNVKISEFRYHEDSNLLNIYIADSEPIFNGSETLNLGVVSAIDTDGNSVEVKITAVEDSLKFVSQNTLTNRSFSVQNEAAETTGDSSGVGSSDKTTTTTASAGTGTSPVNAGDKQVVLEKTVDQSYVIVIPDSTDSLAEEQEFNLSASDVVIPYGQTLKVSVTSANGWKLRDKNNLGNISAIAYTIGFGDSNTTITDKTKTVLTVGNGTQSGDVNLTVLSIDKPEMAGTFADTLTFSVDVS